MEICFNRALKLGHATTRASYVGAHRECSRRAQGWLEAVIKARPAVQFIQGEIDPLGRGTQLICRNECVLPLHRPELFDDHQDTLSRPPEELTKLKDSQP